MSHIRYEEDGDSIIMEGELCPSCNSRATSKEVGYGYWKCEDCSTVWGHDEDDPDYDEEDLCPECGGIGVNGYDGDPDSTLSDQWHDKTCLTCGGRGLVT